MRIGGLGAPELILIVLAIVLIFGASKLGDIGGALGKSVREFRKQTKDPEEEAAEARAKAEVETRAKAETAGVTQEPAPVGAASADKAAPALGDYRPPEETKPS
jgi:sec-independent protein translocase protein TatA